MYVERSRTTGPRFLSASKITMSVLFLSLVIVWSWVGFRLGICL